jgi:hypothetical protein
LQKKEIDEHVGRREADDKFPPGRIICRRFVQTPERSNENEKSACHG